MTFTLRPYQQKVVSEVYSAWALGFRNVLAVLPTGAGKTRTFSHIIREFDGPAVAIAHRHELVAQISLALGQAGVRHGIVAADATIRGIVRLHMDEFGRSFYEPSARVKVASVDTLIRVNPSEPWLSRVGLWVQDECFPAGTLVDGKPIESLKPGDLVTAFNEETGGFEQRPIVRLFRNPMPKNMVRVTTKGHHVLHCTPGHPFFTQRGWVEAANLRKDDHVLEYRDSTETDLHGVQDALPRVQDAGTATEESRSLLLQQGVQFGVPIQDFLGDDGANESQVRLSAHEGQQPDVQTRGEGEGECLAQSDRASAEGARGQRQGSDSCRGDAGDELARTRVCGAMCGENRDAKRQSAEATPLLQNRLRESDVENRHRGGWALPQTGVAQTAGREERRVSAWVGLDSVEILERPNTERLAEGDERGYVFNIEVAGLHTYIAGGIVVHNCHHLLRENKWGAATKMLVNARGLGVTATPCRADGLGLGMHADGVFDWMVEGPTMRELIDMAFLSDYQIFCPPSDLDLSAVPISAGGDFSQEPLRKAVHSSHIVGDAVAHYLKHCAGQRGITFCVDIEAATEQCQAYRAAGVPAEVISSKTPDLIRAQILRKLRNGEVLQVTNVDLVGEGFDLPGLDMVSMCRPTQSFSLYAQQFGRALRIAEGKTVATVLDHVGNVVRHRGPPDMPRKWSLDRREKRSSSKGASDSIPMRVCPQCTRPYERVLPACPFCGHAVEPAGRSAPELVEGDLTLLDRSVFERMWRDVDAAPKFPHGASLAVVGAIKKHHHAKTEAQAELREAMAAWGGVRKAAGDDDRVMQRRFWHTFGVDVVSALALNAADARSLTNELLQRVRP